jgi:hypothetical protein
MSTRVGALPLRWQLDGLAIDDHDDVRLVDNAAARLQSSAHFWFDAKPDSAVSAPPRPDQQRRPASPAWLLTQAERKPPSAGRAAGRRLLVCTRSSDVGSADHVAASRLFRSRRRGDRFHAKAQVPSDHGGDAICLRIVGAIAAESGP